MRQNLSLPAVALAAILVISTQAVAAPRHVQLLAFGVSPSVENSDLRQATVDEVLRADWISMPRSTRGPSLNRPRQAAFVLTPPVRVPDWMKQGPRRLSLRGELAMPLAPTSRCDLRPYRPSGFMGRSSEERRRLLYPLMQEAACAVGLPVSLMDAMLIQESRYNPFALSPKGAFGLGQIMPGTARQLNIDRYDLRSNLTGAAQYLRAHLNRFGRVDLALAAYNAGPGRVSVITGVPRIPETRNYVSTILRNWRYLDRD